MAFPRTRNAWTGRAVTEHQLPELYDLMKYGRIHFKQLPPSQVCLQRFPVILDHSVIQYDREAPWILALAHVLVANRIHFAGTCARSHVRSGTGVPTTIGRVALAPTSRPLHRRPCGKCVFRCSRFR
jgi:hypothetical protein